MVRQSKPYGPTYQEIAEAIALEHGCGTSAMACFHFICRKIDWETGVMPNQLSLKVIAKRIGDVSYRTAYTAMRQLREAGVITYATRGNNYDGGEANVYCFAIPPLQNLQGVPDTPLQNLQGPPCKNDRDPPAKSTGLNPLPSLSRGENAAASRGEEDTNVFVTWEQLAAVSSADWVADTRKHMRMEHEDIVVFSELARAMRANDARRLWKALQKKEALRAAENE